MPRSHRLASFSFLALLAMTPLLVQAQQSHPDDSWIPRGMDALGHHASFHTDFTFDKSMLDLANNFVGDEETHRVVAKLRGISVHSFSYPAPGLYDTRTLDAVRSQYHDRGWKHLVTSQSHTAVAHPSHSDVWIRFEHGDVEGMVLLVAGEKNLNLVAINGELSPLDLLHLRGHFGIPKFSGDDLVEQNN
ncbi:MAG TPA: DUF4252 domain-containing protein [Silvibacterium sp.]|nr:DUF4252 domain-containing protein [Silvibacterium sp.]